MDRDESSSESEVESMMDSNKSWYRARESGGQVRQCVCLDRDTDCCHPDRQTVREVDGG